ncbi:MAG TPA: hypothetical protein VFX16_12935 [Pseudonocardiaceae bacterium]|nr:hypothetical protein [Pseudonocardiaceae bacterium]
MHAGLLTEADGSDLMITMLDGDLGAVIDPTRTVTPTAETLCWCGCIVCFAPPTSQADERGAEVG